MARLSGPIGSTKREPRIKRTKSERNRPNAKRKKPYRGQGRV